MFSVSADAGIIEHRYLRIPPRLDQHAQFALEGPRQPSAFRYQPIKSRLESDPKPSLGVAADIRESFAVFENL